MSNFQWNLVEDLNAFELGESGAKNWIVGWTGWAAFKRFSYDSGPAPRCNSFRLLFGFLVASYTMTLK
ncbi:hypothetical protein J2TS4_43820 [Paenibacillus sp. J2TS4]|nr:hypothetical protein J2TS4_43820 [Paenibacillus sp. J2TS4]